jgi:hypothetical protein
MSTIRRRFTDSAVQALQPGAVVHDAIVSGLQVKASAQSGRGQFDGGRHMAASREINSRVATRALLETLRGRRSRRFGLGMEMPSGPLAYRSTHAAVRLSEEEEAILAFAACGVTGYALADLEYSQGGGGTIMSHFLARTIASGDAAQTVSLIVMNQDATYYIKRPQDFDSRDITDLAELAQREDYIELYRRSRVKIQDGRVAPSLEPLFNINCNQWSLYDSAATYFLPVNEFTWIYINGLLEIFNETTRAFVVDERANFQPAGLKRFARSRGGHLDDDASKGRVVTIQQLETFVTEFVTIETGMMLQNIALMVQAMGLGGFPHWAAHAFGWFKALGFRMGEMKASRYLGMSPSLSALSRWLGRDSSVPYVQGLEREGVNLLTPMCPPYFPSMEAAVRAFVDHKVGAQGIFRGGVHQSAWRDSAAVASASPAPTEENVNATVAYCEYVYQRYGRFPAYQPPLRTVLGFQVNHLDLEFYDRFYDRNALTEAQRQHMNCWRHD